MKHLCCDLTLWAASYIQSLSLFQSSIQQKTEDIVLASDQCQCRVAGMHTATSRGAQKFSIPDATAQDTFLLHILIYLWRFGIS